MNTEQRQKMRFRIAHIILKDRESGHLAADLADEILAIPDIGILDENQELPGNPYRRSTAHDYYNEAQRNMTAAGWKKVLE